MLWIEWLLAVALCAVCLVAVYYTGQEQETLSPSIRSLTDAVMFVARRFQAAIALMLGFYTMQSFNRWREVRNTAGNAMGTLNDLALQIAWRIQERENDENDEKDPEEESDDDDNRSGNKAHGKPHKDAFHVRLKLIRWLNLSHAIVVGDVYEMKCNVFASIDNLVKFGLCTKRESAFLKTQDSRYKYVAPLLWFIDLVEDLQKRELYGVNEGTVNNLTTGVAGLRRSLADLYALKLVPIPLSYKQLTNLTVRMYMLILLLAAILFEKTDEYLQGRLEKGSFWIIMVYAFEYLLFVGWLTVADAIGNPYRAWADQLDWDVYVKDINLNSMLIASRFFQNTPFFNVIEDECEDGKDEKLVKTCRRWDESLSNNGKKPIKGFKARRKVATGF